MASFVDPLVVGCVIGDVVDLFVPSVTMSVYYGAKQVTNGCNVKPSLTVNPPKVTFSNGHPNQLYTLVMVDPDAPSPSEPSMREWVHWIVVDIPGGTNVSHGIFSLYFYHAFKPILRERVPPLYWAAAADRHSPVCDGPISAEEPIGLGGLPNFITRAFANRFDLGLPVATIYFNAQEEPTNRRR